MKQTTKTAQCPRIVMLRPTVRRLVGFCAYRTIHLRYIRESDRIGEGTLGNIRDSSAIVYSSHGIRESDIRQLVHSFLRA